jgi:histidinol dehydrogenase
MNVVAASDTAAWAGLLEVGWDPPAETVTEVAQILRDVRASGDEAILKYARRFDDATFELSALRVPIPILEGARSMIPGEIGEALDLAKTRIGRFHGRQRQPDITYVEEDGTRYAVERRPLRSVAIYAPRMMAAVSILMGAVPAKIAGVPRVIVLCPPAAEGPSPVMLFACALGAVDELYMAGGAQAIGAAAFGTYSIAPVDKIVGRGGVWTTEAKRQVFGRCGIDGLEGPAEAVIVADDGANSEYVVGELLAQAELPRVTRLAVLSESRPLLEAVAQLVDSLDLRTLERQEYVTESISNRCRLIEASSREELLNLVNRLAPAYLCLQVRDSSSYLERIDAAGTVFVGDMTPSISGEYLAGTSRVVPTAGTARFASNLSLADFTHAFSVVENTRERIRNDAPLLAAMAELDRLPHHAQTARMRCDS